MFISKHHIFIVCKSLSNVNLPTTTKAYREVRNVINTYLFLIIYEKKSKAKCRNFLVELQRMQKANSNSMASIMSQTYKS